MGILATPSARAQPNRSPQLGLLTIDRAVDIALERNTSVALSTSKVGTAGAHITSSFGSFLPQLDVQAGYTRQLTDGTVFVQGQAIPGTRPDNRYTASASLSVPIFDGFSRTSTYNAAQSSFTAAMQDLSRVRQDVTFQTRQAFLAALRAEEIIRVRQSDLDVAHEQLTRIQGLVDAGSAQLGQVYQQQADIANAELSLEQARTDAIVAKNTLAGLMNVDPSSPFQLSSEGLAQSVDSAEMAVTRARFAINESLYQQQLDRRGDVRAAQLRVEASRSRITAARAGWFPQLSAGVGYGWTKSGATSSGDATLNLSFSFTPFDGFRTYEQVQIAEADYQNAQAQLESIKVDARSALQNAVARLDGAERQILAADRAVAAARQNRYAADERFKVGTGSYTDYVLASGQYLTAQINQINAVYNYRLAVYDVKYRLGEE